MLNLDEIKCMDNERKKLINKIRKDVFDFILKEQVNGCTIKSIKSDRLVLFSSSVLDDDFIKRFEDYFGLTIVSFSRKITTNLWDDGSYYPVGVTEEWNYIFCSSGGIY